MIRTLTQRIKSYGEYKRVYNQLARMDSRELADIGLNRGDIEDVARGRIR